MIRHTDDPVSSPLSTLPSDVGATGGASKASP